MVTAADGLAQAVDRARTEDSVLRALLVDPALAGDLRDTARSFREVTGRIARGEGVLGALTQPGGEESIKQMTQALARLGQLAEGLGGDAKLGETLADLRQAMADLRAITGRIEGARARSAAWSRTRPSTRTSPRSWRAPSGAFSCAPSSARRSAVGRRRGRRAAGRRREPHAVRPVSVYRCQACGFQAGKWYGRCPDCGEFNTIVEERTGVSRGAAGGRRAASAGGAVPTAAPIPLAAVSAEGAARVHSGVAELDRVLGGGVVPGSLVLIGGDPGIGKSTLLLQASAALAGTAGPVLYVSARSRPPR